MGTRCITEVKGRWAGRKDWNTHAVIYRHWDGYLTGHGRWLADFLDGMHVVNSIPSNTPTKHANGPGRLAAQIVAELQKDGHEPDLMDGVCDCGQEYHYLIEVDYSMSGGSINLKVFDGPMTAFGFGGQDCTNEIFSGTVEQFVAFIGEQEE